MAALKKKNDHNKIIVQGAKVNNLKDVSIDIPRNEFVVVTGLSGSGKSSLAFDTLYAEGNRRYMEGMSSYARNFLDVSSKPNVDKIDNLSPPISIDQKSILRSPRSTVGTLTEIYDYLRILFTKIGQPHCSECNSPMYKKNRKEVLEETYKNPDKTQIAVLSRYQNKKGKKNKEILKQIQQLGYARVRYGGKLVTVSEAMLIADDNLFKEVDVVVDRITLDSKNRDDERMIDSIETAMKIGHGSMMMLIDNKKEVHYNQDFICRDCGIKIKEITPRHFSFNNPEGACSQCSGLGMKMEVDADLIIPNKNLSLAEGAIRPWSKAGGKMGDNNKLILMKALAKKYKFSVDVPVKKLSAKKMDIILYGDPDEKIVELKGNSDLGGVKKTFNFEGVIPELENKYQETKSDYVRKEIEKYMMSKTCPECKGQRLKREYLNVLIDEKSINDLVTTSISNLRTYFGKFPFKSISEENKEMVGMLIKEMSARLGALEDVGLEYLSLSRSTNTISGGEAQRIRLAVQIKSQLMGIVYVLDEPSIGLHSKDTEKLINTIKSLRDSGNSLIVVEHDRDFIKSADWIVDMGPGAGEDGGEVIFEGDVKKLKQSSTSTAKYIFNRAKVFEKKKDRKGNGEHIEIIKAEENNLQGVDFKIPLEKFVVVCGVSGSGKSTMVSDILAVALSKHFYDSKAVPGKHKAIKGLDNVNKVINITQDPIGRTPRSNAATYTGVFSHVREIFAQTEESKNRGYTSSQFSFNMKGGRCEVCQGEGMRKIEMHLLPDMYVKCESCGGTRYNKKTLEIEYQGINIADTLDMSVSYALKFFKRHPLIFEKLKTMEDVGLGYLKLGQSATNLSGGEAQRIKLATELARKSTGKTLYILDEPTIGLHFEDIKKLLKILNALVEKGNTVLVVEHNEDVIQSADWVMELGPEGGDKGGKIIFEGTPEKLKKSKKTWTAKYL